jgi:hypothetical protein
MAKVGRKLKAFGSRLEVPKSFNVTLDENEVIKSICKKLDLDEARFFRQVLFGISTPIKLNKGA